MTFLIPKAIFLVDFLNEIQTEWTILMKVVIWNNKHIISFSKFSFSKYFWGSNSAPSLVKLSLILSWHKSPYQFRGISPSFYGFWAHVIRVNKLKKFKLS